MADETEVTETEETEETEESPENSQETFTAADRAALKKALNAERKQHRDAAAKLAQLEAAGASDVEKQWMEKMSAAETAADARVKKIAARAALAVGGLQGAPERLVGLLDLGSVQVDEDGGVTGLDEQIKTLRSEYPGLFKQATAEDNGSVGRVNTGNRKPVSTAKNYIDLMNEQLGIG